MKNETALREEICRVGHNLYQRGYTVGSAGNISARLDDGWLITPTDACLGTLQPEDIAKVNLDNAWISGAKPSKTLALHRQIYKNNTGVGGIVHTHSTHLVALTLNTIWQPQDILPPITPYQVMKVGHLPMIPYARPGSDSAALHVASLADQVRGVMLERLGPVIWESTVSKAAYVLEELEETAKLWLMSSPKPSPLSDEAIQELIDTFGARW